MKQDNAFLGTEPVGKLLIKLSIPTVLAQLINMLYNVVDRIYIGHIPREGAMALTGVGVCMPIILLISAFASLVCSGGAPRASIAMGAKNNGEAEAILGNCFSLMMAISVVLTAALLIFGRKLLLLFGSSENTISYAVSYMNIYAVGTVFVQLTLGMNMFITAQGFTKVSMLSVVVGAVSNIILDPIFIFLFGMGVSGAALATVISQMISCVWVLVFLFGKKSLLKIRRENLKLSPSVILPCLGLGAAMFIVQTSESVLTICFNSSLLKYGGDIAVGAMTILYSVQQFVMMPLLGFGQGAQPILSYNYGAKNSARVRKTFKTLLLIDLCCSVFGWALIMLFPQIVAGIFTSDTGLIVYASRALRIYSAVLLIFGVQIACQNTFVSLGCSISSAVVAIVRKYGLLLPIIYIMPHIFTADTAAAVYLAEPVADFLAVTFTSILFAFKFRQTMRKIENKEDTLQTV